MRKIVPCICFITQGFVIPLRYPTYPLYIYQSPLYPPETAQYGQILGEPLFLAKLFCYNTVKPFSTSSPSITMCVKESKIADLSAAPLLQRHITIEDMQLVIAFVSRKRKHNMQSERGIPIAKPNIRLKQERELRGWSQSKVAEEVGTSAKIVSRWECGTSSPSPYFRAKLCALYEKNAQDLGLIPDKSEAGYDPPKEQLLSPAAQALLIAPEIILEAPPPAPSSSAPPLPTVSIAEPLQPTVSTGPLQPLRPPRHLHKIFLLTGSMLIVLSLLLAGTYSVLKPTSSVQQQRATIQEAQVETQAFQSKHIGISDGSFAFDIYKGRSDIELKQEAAQALQDNNISSAINLFTQAVSIDPTDGEAQIYAENAHVQQSGSAFVTLVLGLPINGIAADLVLARADMEAAFLAQHEINTKGLLPRYKLHILLDNSGANDNDVGTVTQFIRARIQAGNPDHIVAVIGWPYSLETIDARDIIASVHLPLISQTASSVALSGSSPYFFRVNPTDNQQGTILGTSCQDNSSSARSCRPLQLFAG